ncbi:MAG: carboxypeptidase regulatory-like domain-containing protein [Vicinamibacterales bacterium]
MRRDVRSAFRPGRRVVIWALAAGLVAAAGPAAGASARPGRVATGTAARRLATGTVAGRVTVVTRASRRLASAGAYPGRTVVIPAASAPAEVTNVVVFLKSPPPGGPPPAPGHAEVRQTDETFVPHLVAVTAGSTVDFPNDDLIFHNVFSLSPAATFDLGRYPRGETRARVFVEPGVVKVFCHLHSHMSAIVRVFDHPWFAVPDAEGRFSLEGLPPGRHVITAWHERAGEVSRDVLVEDGRTATLDFSLPLSDGR